MDYNPTTHTGTIVSGLNSLSLPGSTRAEIEVKEFRQTSRKFAGSASRNNIEFSGNAVFNDTGQIKLKTLYDANAKFGPVGNANGECRIYMNNNGTFLNSDFVAPDSINDTDTAFQVSSYDYGSVDVDGVFPFTCGFLCNGLTAIFSAHITGTGIAFVDSDPDTITDSGNGFVTAGFTDGMTIIVEGTVSNDGIYLVDTVAAGTLTLTTAMSLTGEVAGTSFTIHGGK
jgi:hypothetical protein